MKVLKFRDEENTKDIFIPVDMIYKYEGVDDIDETIIYCHGAFESEKHILRIDAETLVDKIFVIDPYLEEIIEIGYGEEDGNSDLIVVANMPPQ